MKRFILLVLTVLIVTSLSAQTSAKKNEVVFTYGRSEEVQKWDTFDQNSMVNYMLYPLIYNYLIGTDHKGNFTPQLATKWKVSDDGLVWTFNLRDDVKFTNGDKLTSSDVKITFDRVINDKTLIRASLFTAFQKIAAPDPTTVVFYLTEKKGDFLTVMCQFPVTPGKLFQAKGVDMFKDNIGSGPWKFVEWVPGQRVVFVRNPDYWGKVTSNVDKIIYRSITEDTTRVSAVRTGDIDMADGVPSDQVSMLLRDSNLRVDRVMSTDQIYIGFRCTESIFSDINARKAVNHAIDRQALVDKIVGGGAPASWPVSSVVMGFDPNGRVPEFNVQLAKDYLSKSKYNGSTIRLIGPNGNYPRIVEVLQAIASMLTDVGFNVNLEMLEGAGFQQRRMSGQYDLYITGCSHGYGDPATNWTQRWVGDSLHSGLKSDTLNNLVLASNRETDLKKRVELLRQAAEEAYKNLAPWAYIYQLESVIVYRKNISNVIIYGDRITDFSDVIKK